MVHVETFKVKRYSFDTGQSFICVTKELMDALPMGREKGSRFRDIIGPLYEEIGIRGLLDSFSCGIKVLYWRKCNGYAVNKLCGCVPWKSSRDFTRPLGAPSGLKGLLHMLNTTVIPMKGKRGCSIDTLQEVNSCNYHSEKRATLRGVFCYNSTLISLFHFLNCTIGTLYKLSGEMGVELPLDLYLPLIS
ncbi:hypothetical protein Tco_1152368 [Tanacetum coccineum]